MRGMFFFMFLLTSEILMLWTCLARLFGGSKYYSSFLSLAMASEHWIGYITSYISIECFF